MSGLAFLRFTHCRSRRLEPLQLLLSRARRAKKGANTRRSRAETREAEALSASQTFPAWETRPPFSPRLGPADARRLNTVSQDLQWWVGRKRRSARACV